MIFRIKLQHNGYTFDMLMEAPSRAEVMRRIQSSQEKTEAKIVSIKAEDTVLDSPHAG